MKKIIFGTAILLLLTVPAQAGDRNVDCNNATNQNDMNYCAEEDFNKADKALNAAYKTAMADMDAAMKAKLKAAQRAWVAFRDAECDYESMSEEGGSMQPMVYSGCRARLTKDRTQDLTEPSY